MIAWKIEIKHEGDLSHVSLVVGPQSFEVTPFGWETPEDAEWVAAQLHQAIGAIERGVLEGAAKYVDGEGEKIAKRTGDMPVLVYSLADGIRKLRGGKP